MNIDQLNAKFKDEAICRHFFEAARWPAVRICPHCSFNISRYLNEFSFRWGHRVPEEKTTKSGKKKITMKPIPVMDMLFLLIRRCSGAHLRRTKQ